MEQINSYSIKDVLARIGITQLNEMQEAVMRLENRKDLILLSPTGSGKTLAFLLPLLSQLKAEERVQALVVAPSRELALQIEAVFRSLGTGMKVSCCYGGHPFQMEKRSLEHPPVLLVGTPGRLLDHIEKGNLNLSDVHTLVLDEFDKSLEMKFTTEMKKIISHIPCVKRRILTSATESIEIPSFVGLNYPERISFLTARKSVKGLKLYKVESPGKDKLDTLYALLGELSGESALVFCNYRESVERVSDFLTRKHVFNIGFHGGMEQVDREQRLALLRNGSVNIFVSTDLAARGLDIPEVRHIIHYHLPLSEESFVHRNGRTARMNKEGASYVILNESETLPEYISPEPKEFFLSAQPKKPNLPDWETLVISRGKRDKVSKKDIVGFLCQKGKLEMEDVGIIEIFEASSFVAVKRGKKKALLPLIQTEKIKNLKARFS